MWLRAVVALALLLGLSSGVVIAAAAGARRTDAFAAMFPLGSAPVFKPSDLDRLLRLPEVKEGLRAVVS